MWTWVASVRWRPPLPNRPRSRSRETISPSSRSVWPSASSRARNSVSTEASKPGSGRSRPSAYFQSSRPRTASAACRSVRPSTNCSTSTSASRAGDHAGRPRAANSSANCSSVNSGPSASRTRIARQPLGNAALATRAVSAGISVNPLGRNDIVSLQPSQPSQPIDAKGQRCHTHHDEFASRVETRGASLALAALTTSDNASHVQCCPGLAAIDGLAPVSSPFDRAG
jgi:hypothetical protein